jgi:ferredoxin
MKTVTRKIVNIDEDKCDGCGLCVPSCAEGAIRVIDGKARLIAETLCDGLGNCLGECPRGAITIEERQAKEFDEDAVEQHLAEESRDEQPKPAKNSSQFGCPGKMLRTFGSQTNHSPPTISTGNNSTPADGPVGGNSRLGQWPVQLTLLPPTGTIWNGADVLLAADCAAYAMGDFHDRLLRGKTLAVACPKLDNPQAYIDKLATIFAENDIRSLTIARMSVPCCGGLEAIVEQAMTRAGKSIPRTVVTIGLQGRIEAVNGISTGERP